MSRRMPDPAGLIAGVAFVGIGLVFLVGEVELANRARWVWPIVLFSLGAGILAAVLGRPGDEPSQPLPEPAPRADATDPWPEVEPGATEVVPGPDERADATDVLPAAEEGAAADDLARERGGQGRAGTPPA